MRWARRARSFAASLHPLRMSPRAKSLLIQIGSFVLGGVLLWLALRNVDFSALGGALKTANYWYLVPMALLTLVSHALRAWRWQMLLEGLPDERAQHVGFRPAFYSLMIGYMVNYAAPRLGEVARTANLAARTKLPFSGVFGTVVVERILDVLTLALGILAALVLLSGRMAGLAPLFAPAADFLREPPVAWWLVVVVGVAVVVGLVALFRLVLRRSVRLEGLARRVGTTLASFRDGLRSVLRARRRLGIVITTIGIWACYWVMTYLPLPMLGIEGLGFADAWVLLLVGSLGMVVPSPGGVGSYHYVTIRTLESLFGVTTVLASAYAVLAHASQLVLYTTVGFLCLLLQGSSVRALRSDVAVHREAEPLAKDPLPADPAS